MGRDQDRQLSRPLLTGEDFAKGVEESKKHAGRALGKILPLGAQVAASAVAYSAGITATQLVGMVLRVSCATPVLGPTLGLLGVGLANVLAGQASRHTRKAIVAKSHPLAPGFWETPQLEDVVLDAVMGACIFKAMGGRFSSVMPSDLTKPGALAFESIPARNDHSEAYAAPSVKRELARIFKRDGCHHCGSRRPPVIGDHMPPNKMMAAAASRDQLGRWLTDIPLLGKVFELAGAGGRRRGPMQRFYPQCQRCSIKQATAVRNGKRLLVLHLHWPRARGEHLSGIFVGLRYNAPDLNGPSGGGGGGGGFGRRSGKWASLTMAAAGAPVMDTHRMLELRSPLVDEAAAYSNSLQQQCPLAPELSSSYSRGGWTSSNINNTSHYLQVAPLTEGGGVGGYTGWQQQQDNQQHNQQQQQQGVVYSGANRGSSPHVMTYAGAGGGYGSGAAAGGGAGGVTQGSSTAAAGGGLKSAEGGKGHGSSSNSKSSSQHQQRQQQRSMSVPGDELVRLPDQNPTSNTGAATTESRQGGAMMMVSLEGWAASTSTSAAQHASPSASPTRHSNQHQHRPAAELAMAPEHAKARAEAAFELNFAPGLTY